MAQLLGLLGPELEPVMAQRQEPPVQALELLVQESGQVLAELVQQAAEQAEPQVSRIRTKDA